jgi:hypothetical protein
MRLTLAALLVAGLVPTAAAQSPSDLERRAFRWSLWATAIPVAAGTVLWVKQASNAWSSTGPDRTGAALLVNAGLVFGPVFGYGTAGLEGRGWRGAGLRAGLTLLSFGTAYAICGWYCSKGDAAYEFAWLAFATGTGLGAASAIYDIARVRHNVRRKHVNSSDRLSVVPVYAPGQRVGVRVAMTF